MRHVLGAAIEMLDEKSRADFFHFTTVRYAEERNSTR